MTTRPSDTPVDVAKRQLRRRLRTTQDLSDLIAERAPQRLNVFLKHIVWPVVEPGRRYLHNWHIDAICEALEAVSAGEVRRLLINVPPRTIKSTSVAVAWPTWEWLLKPELRWLFTSYAQQLSTRDSVKGRRVIESPRYQALLRTIHGDEAWKLTGDQNLKERYENDRTGLRLATSITGTATGEGGDRVVADDPHNASQTESDTVRESVLELWGSVFSTRLNDPATGAMVVVMQRLHQRDVAGAMLSEGGWEHLCLPMRYEAKHPFVCARDIRTVEGELLHPDRIPEAAVQRLERSLGSYKAAGQLQQRPAPAEGGIFQRSWWRYYVTDEWAKIHGVPPGAVERPPLGSMSEMIQSWDMAFKDLSDSDYVVGQVWGRVGSYKYLLAQKRDRMGFTDTLKAVRAMTVLWPDAYLKLIEDKANGPAVINVLRGDVPGIYGVEPQGSKTARAQAVAPQVEAHEVFLPHPDMAPWVSGFVEEHANFPNASNDDQVDACTQALYRLRGGVDPGKPGPVIWE